MENKNMKKHGFTLIELLVVISIIAILMAIMMPALRRAREQAQSVVCRSRLRDMGMVFNLYAQDNENKIPPTVQMDGEMPGVNYESFLRWPSRLGPYYGAVMKTSGVSAEDYARIIHRLPILRCPSQEKYRMKEDFEPGSVTHGWRGTFAINRFFIGRRTGQYGDDWVRHNWRKFDDIIRPAGLPLLGESSGDEVAWAKAAGEPYISYGGVIMYYEGPNHIAYEKGWGPGASNRSLYHTHGPSPNHGNKSNYLFADGHVDSLDIWPWQDHIGTDFHPKRNVNIIPPLDR